LYVLGLIAFSIVISCASGVFAQDNLIIDNLDNLEGYIFTVEEYDYETVEDEEQTPDGSSSSWYYVYERQYAYGTAFYQNWKSGTSCQASPYPSSLHLNYQHDKSFNIGFSYTYSGSIFNIGKVKPELGVDIGKTINQSFGNGYSVDVPAKHRCSIFYRAKYWNVTVTEKKYLEQYLPGIGLKKQLVETKTMKVAKFAGWDYKHESR